MSVLHDFECPVCGRIDYDVICSGQFRKTCLCGGVMDIKYSTRSHTATVHPSERAVIWYNPATGKHATPGRNDIPMPARYRAQGYERREFDTLRSLDSYCKAENLVNEHANYDRNGRSFDDE